MKKKLFAFILVLVLLNCSVFFSSAQSDVVVISPDSVVYDDNLFISIKVLEGKSINVSVYSVNKDKETDLIFGPKKFKSDSKSGSKLSFYTAQIEDIDKGSYIMVIKTKNSKGKDVTIPYTFVVKDKSLSEKKAESTEIFDSERSDTLDFVQNILKSIFD